MKKSVKGKKPMAKISVMKLITEKLKKLYNEEIET